MCDFKPGDEVVCVDAEIGPVSVSGWPPLQLRSVYTIGAISDGQYCLLREFPKHTRWLCQSRFRKVQRRDLSAWLKTSVGNTDKLDRRRTKKARA